MTNPLTYKDAGVNIDAKTGARQHIRELARSTYTPEVLSEIGAFGGMFECKFPGVQSPVLVSSTDGVGTKLKVAVMMNRHNTVGRDLVNHCVNDILVQGARPLFFLDYIAMGRLERETLLSVIEGLADACRDAGCALIGGETAEMPGFYADGEYDLAGFIVGVVDKAKVIDGKSIRHDDVLIGIASSGLHTNGYSLARKVFFEIAGLQPNGTIDGVEGTIGDALLRTHINYEPVMREALAKNLVEGLAHITGGGITENLDRILPADCQAQVQLGSWPVPALFKHIATIGNVEQHEMLRATNMGIGMIAVVRPSNVQAFTATLKLPWYQIGKIIPGQPIVSYTA